MNRLAIKLGTRVANYSSVGTANGKAKLQKGYEASIEYLNNYKERHLKLAEEYKSQLNANKGSKELEDKIKACTVEAYLHLPETEKKFQTGEYDIKEVVYQHMLEKQWKNEQSKVVLQRLTQMYVIPDVLKPDVSLNFDLSLSFKDKAQCGQILDCETVMKEPEVKATLLHEDTRLYTLVLTDPDSPNEANKTYRECIHWMVSNIPLNSNSKKIDLSQGTVVADYLPPHPQFNTNYHRYTAVLLEQKNPIEIEKVPSHEFGKEVNEKRFLSVRDLIEKNQLQVCAASFFRCKHDNTVSTIYKDVLGLSEPEYGPKPNVNPRVGLDGRVRNRYLNL
ncbi:PEBP-like protein [Neoconidiobolus thromboides FSU 785]|nr:PEBP-like protein [Neoconidiobolus thromboides FSU 785]